MSYATSMGIMIVASISTLPISGPKLPGFVLDAMQREPRLYGISQGALFSIPDAKEFAGRPYSEYLAKCDELQKAYLAALPKDTADYIYGKLHEAVIAEPPDLPIVWAALAAAQYVPDPRIPSIADELLSNLAETGEGRLSESICKVAMSVLVHTGDEKYIARVSGFLQPDNLKAIEKEGYRTDNLVTNAFRSLERLPKVRCEEILMRVSQELEKHLTENKEEDKSVSVELIQRMLDNHFNSGNQEATVPVTP